VEKHWPAVDASGADPELLMAAVDETSPSAVEERPDGVRIFFTARHERDNALRLLAEHGYRASAVEVSDEDWAARSQADLAPITIGRFTIFPRPTSRRTDPYALIVAPSTAFGTGHHATTRLCLQALQQLSMEGRHVLDVGTGSGILAIAAARLGAARVLGIDTDGDAVRTARETLALNGGDRCVTFRQADISALADPGSMPEFDVIAANLTGALLVSISAALLGAARRDGHLVLSGFTVDEAGDVAAAFARAAQVDSWQDDGWAAFVLQR
jgi:ribosomal protein L11 methyltransferase